VELNTALSGPEMARTRMDVDAFNKTLASGKTAKQGLDKDDFLKLLVTQLQHQDPTAPVEDKEFIAQMASFSSLEQMSNMSQGFQKLTGILASSEASQMLGKKVEIEDGDTKVTGLVDRVLRGDNPLVGVNGKYYEFSQVVSVIQQEG
jgi:flagellar basal-body rod modification protein FlgD